jgi:hypothetical protein
MSFAGHVFDMIARMKANAQRKRRPFEREVETGGQSIRPEYLRKASEEELAYLREKTLRDQRIQQRRTRIVFVVVVFVILGTLLLLQWGAAA